MNSIPFHKSLFKKNLKTPVAVVGAGPSLDQTKHKLKDYDLVIGVNFTYQLVQLDYCLIAHFMPLLDIFKGAEKPECEIIYSNHAIDWMFAGAENPDVKGIRFQEYRDIYCGTSTIIPAIDLACMLSREVHLFGVDLCKSNGVQYTQGYPSRTHDDKVFSEWARIVEDQIAGLQRITKAKILRMK